MHHNAWFNEGAPVPVGTVLCIFTVPPNTQTDPNAGDAYIINPSTTQISAVDIYGRTIPATTTLKIDVATESQQISPSIQNTSEFYTYTGPFTIAQALPGAAVGPTYYLSSKAFDTVTGPGPQGTVQYYQTVPNNPE